MTKIEREIELWQNIGALHALANPDGLIATELRVPVEKRMAEIWEILQRMPGGGGDAPRTE